MDKLPWLCLRSTSLLVTLIISLYIIVESAKISEAPGSSFGSNSLQGEPASVTFLTTVRKRREAIKNDYHILQIDLPQSNTSFRIHLVKNLHSVPPELPILVHDGNSTITMLERNSKNCLYLGTTSMESNEVGDNKNESAYGTAAVSLCNLKNGRPPELNGLLIVGAQHFVLQPNAETSKNSTAQITPHVVFRITNSSKIRNHDVLRVPKEELKKAIEQMKSRNSIDESGNSTVDSTNAILTAEDADVEEDSKEEDYDAEQSLREDYNIATPIIISSTGKKKKKTPIPTKSNKMIIEIAVFTDAALFRKLKMKTSKETITRVKNMALATINEMNLLYKHPSMGVDLSFRLVHLEIMKSNPKKMDTHNGVASKYLDSFCKYAGDKNTKGNLWDHALMLTGINTVEDGDDSIIGMAWGGTMCLRYWSCSISEGYSFGSAFTVAHEIGHSLGMEHDGDGPSFTCDPDLYLMSATSGFGKVTWSKCSTSNVKQFIKTGNPEVGEKDPEYRPLCLTKNSPIASKAVKFGDGRLPGQIFETADQCRLECGKNCTPYKKTYHPYNNVCGMIYCQKLSKTNEKEVREAHPALEGTQCDKGKHCRGAKCVTIDSSGKKGK